MSEQVRLTHAFIDQVKPPASGRLSIRDTEAAGLQLSVTSHGSRVWYFVGRVHKRAQRIKLGNYPTVGVEKARREARRIAGEIASGLTPTTATKTARDAMTLGRLFEWYHANLSIPHKSTHKRDRLRFDRYFSDWRHEPLDDISRARVRGLHASIGDTRGRVAANDMLTLLRLLYQTAQDEMELPVSNPASGVTRFAVESRDRYLSGEELARLFAALESVNADARDFILLCLWTGARRGNVMAMEWSEIDLDAGTWSLPASKTKRRKPLLLVLSSAALAVLKSRPSSGRYVFPSSRSASGHYVEPKTAWGKIVESAKLPGVRLHDLRRTFASFQAANNVSLHTIGKSLGHSSEKSTAIYARLQLDTVRKAVDAATESILKASEKNLRKSE
jgi:integrase